MCRGDDSVGGGGMEKETRGAYGRGMVEGLLREWKRAQYPCLSKVYERIE